MMELKHLKGEKGAAVASFPYCWELADCCRNGQVQEAQESGASPGWMLFRMQSSHREER